MIQGREQRAICRIAVSVRGEVASRGTGFLYAGADGRRFVLTALHVVARPGSDPPQVGEAIGVTFLDGAQLAVHVATDSAGPLWSREDDWVLLAFPDGDPSGDPDADPGADPLAGRVPLRAGRTDGGQPWDTWGFPKSNVTGHALSGRFANLDHRPAPGRHQHQLHSPGATGLLASGISGGPVLVDGAVVGLIGHSLQDADKEVRGGTLYATPIARVVEGARGALDPVDLCAGLPAPKEPPPAEPFHYLQAYAPSHAAVFFGRCAAIRRLLDWADTPDARLLLLFGASGVGKSSLLNAGFLPRVGQPARLTRWGEPLDAPPDGVWILDQAEGAFQEQAGERLGDAVRGALATGVRVIVSFRKEWLPEVDALLAHHGPWRLPLPRLDAPGVAEAVHGLALLPNAYALSVEEGLGDVVARDLLASADTPVAPYLQVLLSDMWERVKGQDVRTWNTTLYTQVRTATGGIAAFLDRQLGEAARADRAGAAAGLHLDVLAAHVAGDVAGAVSGAALTRRYGPTAHEAAAAVRVLEAAWLLTRTGADGTRLAHDTLAPLIRARHGTSSLPGQRAVRILEGRGIEAEGEVTFLRAAELKVVDAGRAGMRAWTPRETTFVADSRRALRRQKWVNRVLLAVGGVTALVIAGLGVWGSVADGERTGLLGSDRAARMAALAAAAIEDERLPQALAWAVAAVDAAPEEDPRREAYATLAVQTARAVPWVAGVLVTAAVQRRNATFSTDLFPDVTVLRQGTRIFASGPIGAYVADLGPDGALTVARLPESEGLTAPVFDAAGTLVASGSRVWSLEGKRRLADAAGSVVALAAGGVGFCGPDTPVVCWGAIRADTPTLFAVGRPDRGEQGVRFAPSFSSGSARIFQRAERLVLWSRGRVPDGVPEIPLSTGIVGDPILSPDGTVLSALVPAPITAADGTVTFGRVLAQWLVRGGELHPLPASPAVLDSSSSLFESGSHGEPVLTRTARQDLEIRWADRDPVGLDWEGDERDGALSALTADGLRVVSDHDGRLLVAVLARGLRIVGVSSPGVGEALYPSPRSPADQVRADGSAVPRVDSGGEVSVQALAPPGTLLRTLPTVEWARFVRGGDAVVSLNGTTLTRSTMEADATTVWKLPVPGGERTVPVPAVERFLRPTPEGAVGYLVNNSAGWVFGTAQPDGTVTAVERPSQHVRRLRGMAAATPTSGVFLDDLYGMRIRDWGGGKEDRAFEGAAPVLCADGRGALVIAGSSVSRWVLGSTPTSGSGFRATSREHFRIPRLLIDLCKALTPFAARLAGAHWTPMWPEDGPDVPYDPSASLYPDGVRRWARYWFDFPVPDPAVATTPNPLVAVTAEEDRFTTTDGVTGPGNLQIWDAELDLPLSPIWRFPAEVRAVAFRPDAVRVLTADGEVRDVPFRRTPAADWMATLDDLVGQRAVEDANGLVIVLGWAAADAVKPDTYNADLSGARAAALSVLRATGDADAIAIVERLEQLGR